MSTYHGVNVKALVGAFNQKKALVIVQLHRLIDLRYYYLYTSGPPPRDPVTTPGYSYDEPRVTLPVRPPTTSPPALYGAPRAQRRLRNN